MFQRQHRTRDHVMKALGPLAHGSLRSPKDSLRSSFEPSLTPFARTPFASRPSLRSGLAGGRCAGYSRSDTRTASRSLEQGPLRRPPLLAVAATGPRPFSPPGKITFHRPSRRGSFGSCLHKYHPGGLEGRGGVAPQGSRLSGRLSARAVRRALISRSATASPPRASISRSRWRSQSREHHRILHSHP